jgi:galactose mutarotase-like enzyme
MAHEYMGRVVTPGDNYVPAAFPFDPKTGDRSASAPLFQLDNSWHQFGLHGPAKQREFDIVRSDQSSVTFRFDSRQAQNYRYPSKLLITTKHSLLDGTHRVDEELENVGDEFTIVGGGSHSMNAKYPAGTMLGPEICFNAAGALVRDPRFPNEAMPIAECRPIAPEDDFSKPRVPQSRYDHSFTGWDGRATAFWKALGLKLEIVDVSEQPTQFVHLWYDAEKGTWAIEPVIAPGNAFNLVGFECGVRVLAPGEKLSYSHEYRWSLVS